ncbi:MAG: type II secretion system protein [Oscillibacter sp.]|nr:type II secretion system protein [Oscillibacter sp.]
MKKLNTKAGFTLAELLIVVAIIAILVAIGIPVFSTAMERSRETVDLANIRAAYAEFQSGQLSSNGIVGGVYKIDFKQTDKKGWLIDTTGLKNLLAPDKKTGEGDAAKYTDYSLDTPEVAGSVKNAVNFWVDGEGKPRMQFIKFDEPAKLNADPNKLGGKLAASGESWQIALSDTPDMNTDGTQKTNTDGTPKYKFEVTTDPKTTYYLYKVVKTT